VTQASRTLIPVEESFGAWRKDLQYVEANNAIEELAKPEVIDGKTCSFFAWSSPIFQRGSIIVPAIGKPGETKLPACNSHQTRRAMAEVLAEKLGLAVNAINEAA